MANTQLTRVTQTRAFQVKNRIFEFNVYMERQGALGGRVDFKQRRNKKLLHCEERGGQWERKTLTPQWLLRHRAWFRWPGFSHQQKATHQHTRKKNLTHTHTHDWWTFTQPLNPCQLIQTHTHTLRYPALLLLPVSLHRVSKHVKNEIYIYISLISLFFFRSKSGLEGNK